MTTSQAIAELLGLGIFKDLTKEQRQALRIAVAQLRGVKQ